MAFFDLCCGVCSGLSRFDAWLLVDACCLCGLLLLIWCVDGLMLVFWLCSYYVVVICWV